MAGKMPDQFVKIVGGYSVRVLRMGSRWAAEWTGHDRVTVRIVRPSLTLLMSAVDGSMKLRGDK